MEKGKKRLAVLVGCNYPNTRYELHGCINDVLAMKDVLVNRFGFDPSHVQLLTDAPGSVVMPTGANIKAALENMVQQAEAGDVLFFHYSGHGTRIPSVKTGHPFRQDEAIVPSDFNLITDIDFRQLVNKLPKGASFTIISDSCHSGGLIDKEKEQIGPSTIKSTPSSSISNYRPKTIPFQSILDHLTSLTSINTLDIATHLLEFFGVDASLRFRIPQIELDLFESLRPDEGILLSGCQANETSADMNGIEGGGKAYGAFSNAVQMVLKENKGGLSNKEVVLMARKILEAQGIEQHPCLYCSDGNADAIFLWQQPDESD
ncbi:Peptidase C14, caspase catalytic [Corchorus capsularis]|uniref:Peptidase C14, caspase catalytic n=1 Tax=Corchorus capsularis TaxID=210143 RepID=A0A1R3G726_COCAP|nr:Peptidase C14, caspase catalytic [Corchorus capsularis]